MKWKLSILFLTLLTSLIFLGKSAQAVECTDAKPPDSYEDGVEQYWKDVSSACLDKIIDSHQQQSTLKQAISILNSKIIYATAQINQTKTQIKQTEEEIEELTEVIGDLSSSQEELDEVYKAKVREFYKNRQPSTASLFLSSDSFGSFFTNVKYLQTVRLRDKLVLAEIEKFRLNYDQRKQVKENKQQELEILQKNLLAQNQELKNQQNQKNQLLIETKNNEQKFQQLLSNARKEQAAITAAINQAISSLKNGEFVEKGTAVGLMGSTGYSSGPHLHLEITDKKGNRLNPASKLSSKSVVWDLCGWWPICDQPFPFTGDWSWPLNEPIRITQGFGMTGYAQTGAYNGNPHTGIDMVGGGDITIRAPQAGTLYKGMIDSAGANYIAIEHSDTISWYWHLQ